MKNPKFIQAEVSSDVHRRFGNHPLHRGKNQRPFAGEVLEKWLESPEAQLPILKEELRMLSERVLWMGKQLDLLPTLEARLAEMERKLDPCVPPAAAAS
jgi:hypothetical protein